MRLSLPRPDDPQRYADDFPPACHRRREFLAGEWRADRRPEYSYRVVERDHCMQSEYWGGYSRHNKLYREVYDAEGRCVDVQYVTRNDALMMYSPFLAENAQPGKRPADNQRPGYE